MNQRERLAICSSCTNRKLDREHGYICQLTGRVADFSGTCKDYNLDATVTDTIRIRTKDRPFVPLFDPPPTPDESSAKRRDVRKKGARKAPVKRQAVKKEKLKSDSASHKAEHKKALSKEALMKLKKYQNFLYAFFGGILVAAISALGWGFATEMTGYQGAYFAPGVGLLVGLSIRYFGAGFRAAFGILAALLTLAGSALGYCLSQSGFPENLELAALAGVIDYLSPDLVGTLQSGFAPVDLIYYGLAALLAYLLAIRWVGSRKRARLESDGYKGAPALYWFRLPLILILIMVPAGYGYTLMDQDEGSLSTLYYDSGAKMSEGEIWDGQETGEWTSWHENGIRKSVGYYKEGQKDSLWKWYDESGILTGRGMYADGVENGSWVNYYADGVVSDSGAYIDGLKEGLWEYFHETGSLKSSVNYKAGNMHGEKILVSTSGTIVKIEQYENGSLIETSL